MFTVALATVAPLLIGPGPRRIGRLAAATRDLTAGWTESARAAQEQRDAHHQLQERFRQLQGEYERLRRSTAAEVGELRGRLAAVSGWRGLLRHAVRTLSFRGTP